jgi:hypothetical protein
LVAVSESVEEICLQFDGVEFRTRVSSHLRNQAEALLTACAGLRNSPKGLADGHLVQLGGPMYMLRREGEAWRLMEPDYSTGGPVADVQPDITTSLAIQMQQLLFSGMVGVTPQDCGWMERISYPTEFDWAGSMHMQRYPASFDGDSGWSIMPVASDGGPAVEYMHGPVYSLLYRRPAAMVALLLPTGTFTVLDEDDQFLGVAGEGDVVLWQP